jgi:polysaccharide pyruvyl transferase CsaB
MKKSKKKQKKVLISGYYGFDNFGDEAILKVLIEKLKKLDTKVRVLSHNPSKTEKMYNVNATQSLCLPRTVLRILQSDILITGGGSLLQDVTSLKSLLYYLFVISTALFFRKKVIIFAQGIGPITSNFGVFLTKLILKRCTLLTIRDEKSLFLLRGWGLKPELVCDPLFDIELIPPIPLNKVGVQLRSFKTLKENLLIKLAEYINKEFSQSEIEIYSFQDSLDLEICQRFENILRSINPIIQTNILSNLTSKEVTNHFSRLEYMIAMRFHANLIALKYGIKTLAVSYDEKVEKLAKEAQIPCVSMLGNEDYDKVFQQLKDLERLHLLAFSNSKHFDWTKIEEIVKI